MIVADASWVVALRDPADDYHHQAVAIHRQIGNEDALLHPVTLAECLVAPAQLGVLEDSAAALRAAFEIPDIDHDAPLRWAALRAETGLRLPYTIVLDTALRHDARALATFDTKLATVATARRIDVLGGSAGLARQ
ncbi:MAG: PIN domain-containing protein [Acidimicrobiaceae bacterium]|nr:PIN domain-containing protein [Acidimicrobiaceae bacterium]